MSSRNTLENKYARRLLRCHVDRVTVPTISPKNFAVKIALKLTKLTLAQLLRRQKQAARRAATVKHIIADLSPGSLFAIELKSQQTHQLSLLRQVTAEIASRNHQKS